MNAEYVPKLSTDVHIEPLKGSKDEDMFFVLDSSVPSWVIINKDGVELLKLCNGRRSLSDIANMVSQRSEVQYSKAFQSVEEFIEQMGKKLIIDGKGKQKIQINKFQGLALEITKKCNLRCRHCYLGAGDLAYNELCLEEIKELVSSIKEAGGVSVAIGGGEPLLRDDCFDIIEHALSCDLLVSIGTNATLIDEKLASSLAQLPIKIQVSLDGATEEVHDRIRGKGSYAAAVRGIDSLVQNDKAADMVIAFTPMKYNIHEASEIIDLAREKTVPVVQYPPLTSSGRAKEQWGDLRPGHDEMINFWQTVRNRSKELRGEMDILADCFSINIDKAGTPYRCSIGKQFRVDPVGNVYPCQCFHYGDEYRLGNVRSDSLRSMIDGVKIEYIRNLSNNRSSMIDGCCDCKWMNYCGAGCMGNAFETNGTALSSSSCDLRKSWITSLFADKFEQVRKI